MPEKPFQNWCLMLDLNQDDRLIKNWLMHTIWWSNPNTFTIGLYCCACSANLNMGEKRRPPPPPHHHHLHRHDQEKFSKCLNLGGSSPRSGFVSSFSRRSAASGQAPSRRNWKLSYQDFENDLDPVYLEPWRWGSKAGSSPPCWKPSSKPGHKRSPHLNHRSFFWKILKTIRGIILILIAAPESSMEILSQRSAIKGFGAAPLYFCKCQTCNWIIGILEDHGPITRLYQSPRMDIGHHDGKRPHSRIRRIKSQKRLSNADRKVFVNP